MNTLLEKLLNKQDLTFDEAHESILWMMSEEANPTQTSAFLALLQAKGISVDELAGAALAMRERSSKIQAPDNVIDTCSTGGNGISTFNISTCAAIIAAAAGATVAKHGNRSNTRRSGSAEALEALGVKIDLNVSQVEKCLQETNLCFCYAIQHHPAMRFVGPIRKRLGIPTIFNMLGPLTNPANAKRQLIGVPHKDWTPLIAKALDRLGAEHTMVVSGADGLCELTTTATTYVTECRHGQIKEYEISADALGLKQGKLEDIQIDTPQASAQMIEQILVGENQGTARDIALLNTAGALVVAGLADDLHAGLEQATTALDSGKALEQLKTMIDHTDV